MSKGLAGKAIVIGQEHNLSERQFTFSSEFLTLARTWHHTSAVAVHPMKRCVRSNRSWKSTLNFGHANNMIATRSRRIMYVMTAVAIDIFQVFQLGRRYASPKSITLRCVISIVACAVK